MSDTSLATIFHYGTNAERTAFTPAPASGVKQVYVWYETDTDTTWVYTTGWHQISGSGAGVTAGATLTANRVVLGAGASAVTVLGSLGTTTTVLHGNAAGAPTFSAVSLSADVSGVLPGSNGGGLVLLEQHTASASAVLEFTTALSSSYDEYQIHLVNVVPATNATDLKMLISTGAVYDTGNNYYSGVWYVNNSGSGGNGNLNQNPGAYIQVFTAISNTFDGVCGRIVLFNPLSTSVRKSMTIDVTASQASFEYRGTGFGVWNNSGAAMDKFKFLFSSGNIASGTIRVYGVAKS